ncbi:substrate-binding periplasmic protein [Marinobacter sp. F4206]|uniref:substrate-binding periplasmic protein n=1 Tax=Marinobacter sp. F4206 TaxID=2861777 RepID=UPI001C5F51E0|nr:transporter substrate-binding domain-containing protein [Marinobacter sp. F4206]MBW4934173.1 transporter substrate-binding domain-containing protein [Marinobacter sp. F4206]
MKVGGFFLFFLLLCAQPVRSDESSSHPLVFCNSHWPPYSYGDTNGRAIGGYAIDFMEEISRRTKQSLDLRILPWLRCLQMAQDGDVDGIMLLTENEERKQFLLMSGPIISDANLLWYRKDSPHARSRLTFADLQGLRIGVVTGFNYGEPFNQAVAHLNLTLDEGPSIQSNFKRLDRGWIDVVLVNRMAANYSLHDYPLLRARVISRDGPFEPAGFRIGLAKAGRAAHLLADIDNAIADMRTDGTIDRIMLEKPFEYR